MAFQEIGGEKNYKTWSKSTPGEVAATGWYTKKDKNHYGAFYEITDEEGEVRVLNKSGLLDYRIKDIPFETYMRVTFLGKQILEEGPYAGKPCNNFKIEVDNEKFGKRPGHAVTATVIDNSAIAPDDLSDLL